MRQTFYFILLPLSLMTIFLGGCTNQNNYTIPNVIQEEISNLDNNATQQDKWWENFNDPELNNLIELALRQNLSLLATSQRVNQAYSQLKISGSSLYPSVDASLQRQSSQILNQNDNETRSYKASLSLNYAIDLWGKTGSLVKSRQYNYLAQYQSYRFSALLTAKEVTNLYFSLGALIERKTLLEEQLNTAKNIHKALDIRFAYGKTEYANLLEQERQIEIIQGLIISNDTNIAITQKALAVLIGKSPRNGINTTPILPQKVSIPQAGFSSTLVQQRADVQAAYLTLQSVNENTAATLLDRYPNITLSLGLNSNSQYFSGLFEDWLLTTLGNIVAPIFQGGAIEAEISRSKFATQEAAYLYADTFINALNDIEQSLLIEKEKSSLLKNKEKQINLLEKRVSRIQDAYDNGTLSYIEFIGIIQTWQNLKQDYITAKESHLKSQADLYFSLGSSWQPSVGRK